MKRSRGLLQGIIVLDALLEPRPSRGYFQPRGLAERRRRCFELLGYPLDTGSCELSFRAFLSIILDVAATAESRHGGARYSSLSSVEALVPRGSRA